MTSAEIAAWCAAGGSLLTVAVGAFVKALINLRKSDDETDAKREARNVEGYKLTIEKMDQRISALEAALDKAHHDHSECLRGQAKLEGQVELLQRQVAELSKGAK